MTSWRPLLTTLACAGALSLGACANSARSAATNLPTFRDANMSLQAASASAAPGKTTKAEVLAALGVATVLRFDSGFEVWVYRLKPPSADASAAEFVILFTPDGIASKTRIRPHYDKVGG